MLRATAALVMAIAGGAVAFLAPSAATSGTPDWAGVLWRLGAVGGVVACLLVAGSSAMRLSGRRDSLSTAAVVLGWVTILGLFLGAIYGVATDVSAGDAGGVSFIVAIPAAAAVVLSLIGRGLVDRSPR